jgi:hypothetical protein
LKKKFLHRKKYREMVIGYTFRVGYIYRADCNYFTINTSERFGFLCILNGGSLQRKISPQALPYIRRRQNLQMPFLSMCDTEMSMLLLLS